LVEDRQRELEDIGQLRIEYSRSATTAEKFKAYLDAFQAKKLFKYWDYHHVLDVRHDIFQVLHKEQNKRKLSPNADGKKLLIESIRVVSR
jgi:hypothetical protein